MPLLHGKFDAFTMEDMTTMTSELDHLFLLFELLCADRALFVSEDPRYPTFQRAQNTLDVPLFSGALLPVLMKPYTDGHCR